MKAKRLRVLAFLGILVIGAALISGCAGRPAEAPPEEAEVPKATLEIEVIDVDGNPASGVEVWVWESDQFGRDPRWTQHTGQDGIALFDLPVGMYVVSLRPDYFTSPEQALRNILYFEIETEAEVVKRFFKLPETVIEAPPEEAPPSQLSEQPDEAAFREYFSDIGLGKLPAGAEFPEGVQQNITVLTTSDEICMYGTVTQEVLLSVAVYDTVAKEFTQPKRAFPRAL